MKITYRLSRRDIFYASAEALFHQPFVVALFAIMFIISSYQNWRALPPNRTLVVMMITFGILELIPILVISIPIVVFLFISTISQRNKTLLSEQTMTLDENFMGSQSEYVRSEINWKAVQRIVRTGHYVYLYVSQLGAMVIPKRAFTSKEQLEEFVEFCSAKSRSG